MLKSELVEEIEKMNAIIEAGGSRLTIAIDDADKAEAIAGKLKPKIERLREAIRSRLIVIEPDEDNARDVFSPYQEMKETKIIVVSEEIKLLRYLETILREDKEVKSRW